MRTDCPPPIFLTANGLFDRYEELVGLRVRCLDQTGRSDGTLPMDDQLSTAHVFAVVGGNMVGCGSLMQSPLTAEGVTVPWRMRALAVDPHWRGVGIGRALIEHRLRLSGNRGAWASVRQGASERLHLALGAIATGPALLDSSSWASVPMLVVLHAPDAARPARAATK